MWEAIAVEPDELHIVPQNDLIDHDASVECICGPVVDRVLDAYLSEGLKIILHMALDGREFIEKY
jgi:hypothetical protein